MVYLEWATKSFKDLKGIPELQFWVIGLISFYKEALSFFKEKFWWRAGITVSLSNSFTLKQNLNFKISCLTDLPILLEFTELEW